jgi:hydroxypyruvate reductase
MPNQPQFEQITLNHKKIDLISDLLKKVFESADPFSLVNHSILLSNGNVCIGKTYQYSTKRARLVSIGKAGLPMAAAALQQLGARVESGVCVSKVLPADLPNWPQVKFLTGSHPVPDARSVAAGAAVADCLAGLSTEELVLVLVSGGASALVSSPRSGIELADLQRVNQLLLKSGATINEMNAVRKHLENLKGGGLARLAAPARVEALILSDVIGDDLSTIASGPTVADSTTFADVQQILARYDLTDQIPASVAGLLAHGQKGEIPETVKLTDPCLQQVHNTIIGSNRLAIEAACAAIREKGGTAEILNSALVGEAREVSCQFIRESQRHCLGRSGLQMSIAGGETTVTVHGQGKGGRNLEAALAAVPLLADDPEGLFFTLATDGEDGPTDAAGAIVHAATAQKAQVLGLDLQSYLANNDAYTFFERVGGLIKTGSTGTNVNDLMIYLRCA